LDRTQEDTAYKTNNLQKHVNEWGA